MIVITPMMTAGGEHAEVDIPAKIDNARPLYPEIEFIYAWPFNRRQVAGFLAAQVNQGLSLRYTRENELR